MPSPNMFYIKIHKNISNTYSTEEPTSSNNVFEKYNYGTMSEDFMKSTAWISILYTLISRFENTSKSQTEVDKAYDSMLSCIFEEMDSHFEYTSASKRSRKHYKNHKPFWNSDLTTSWKIMVDAEKCFKQSPQNTMRSRHSRDDFIFKRKKTIFTTYCS